jgi:glycosyltransferase involved in cell wall biosynthesis
MKVVIAQVGSALTEGGIPQFIFELSSALIKDGNEAYVISGREVPKTQITIKEMFGVEKLPKVLPLLEVQTETLSGKLDRDMMKEFLLWLSHGSQLLEEIAPDMIIANGAVPVFSSTFKVVVCHDLELRARARSMGSYSLLRLYDRAVYRMFDKVATTSTELAQAVPFKLAINSEKVIIIPICIDTHKYVALPLEQRDHAVLHVGTWSGKNLEATVKAFCKLAKTDPKIKLYIVGDLPRIPEDILSKVRGEFSRRIFCVGRISKVKLRDLYSKVKVTSVPSIYQIPVLSPTVLESLASGTPVVGGSTAISADLLVDGYNGFKVYPSDFNTLSERISLLTKNNELWSRFSVNAQSTAKLFDSSVVARKYVRLYNNNS